jgi:hypothetical protein
MCTVSSPDVVSRPNPTHPTLPCPALPFHALSCIRCFPDCCVHGHKDNGFCGREAAITIYNSGIARHKCAEGAILAVAEFRPSHTPGLSSLDSIKKSDLLNAIRTPENPQGMYSLGEILPDTSTSTSPAHASSSASSEGKGKPPPLLSCVHIEFNRDLGAWHYGWRSSKWHMDVPHVMDVVLLEDTGGNDLSITASFLSNEFAIVSTKKGRNERKEKAGSKTTALATTATATTTTTTRVDRAQHQEHQQSNNMHYI